MKKEPNVRPKASKPNAFKKGQDYLDRLCAAIDLKRAKRIKDK